MTVLTVLCVDHHQYATLNIATKAGIIPHGIFRLIFALASVDITAYQFITGFSPCSSLNKGFISPSTFSVFEKLRSQQLKVFQPKQIYGFKSGADFLVFLRSLSKKRKSGLTHCVPAVLIVQSGIPIPLFVLKGFEGIFYPRHNATIKPVS